MPSAPRAAWKGFLRVGSVTCGVKLFGVVSEAEKIRFSVLNRKTGNKVRSIYVDEETEEEVPTEEQVKGWESDKGEYIQVEPDDIKALKLTSDHTLDVEEFVAIKDIDTRYLEKPYYVVPADRAAAEPFAVLRDAMKKTGMAARSCVAMYQHGHEVVIQPYGKGMLLTWLRNKNTMVSEKSVFEGIPTGKQDKELMEIAGLLIDKKLTKFDPSHFEDTYEEALAEMIDAKRKGKKVPTRAPARPKENVVNLFETLKKSLKEEGIDAPVKKSSSGSKRGRKAA